MASSEDGRKLRIAACRLTYRDSVYSEVKDFERNLRELFKDRSCAFFGRQIGVDPSGKACYDVVIDLAQRRQISDVGRVFGLKDDGASVELYSYAVRGDTAFVAREVGNICYMVCGVGRSDLWFGELHERVGVCGRIGKCVEEDRLFFSGEANGEDGVGQVVDGVVDCVSRDVRDVIDRGQYSEETVARAKDVVTERLRLAELRFVHSFMHDRIGSNPSTDEVFLSATEKDDFREVAVETTNCDIVSGDYFTADYDFEFVDPVFGFVDSGS